MLKPVLPSPAQRWKARNPWQHASFPYGDRAPAPTTMLLTSSCGCFRYQGEIHCLLEAAADSCTLVVRRDCSVITLMDKLALHIA